MSRGMGGHQSAAAGKTEWLTPPWLIEQLGPFDLDPCAPAVRPWDTAKHHLCEQEDGLALHWSCGHWVWCNPPYGKEAAAWLEKLAAHPGGGIALVFARVETAMFFDHVWPKASALLFLRGRLHFHHVDGTRAAANSGAPSVLVGYGNRAVRTLGRCADLGWLVLP